jgi:SAM-dependent methyltransferase
VYDSFMGRYSRPLAVLFADAAAVERGQRVLDVGCGPGALTGELVERVGADQVSAMDPSEPFAEACSERFPGVEVRVGRGEAIPYDDAMFDRALSQLVLHFVSDGEQVATELRRVVRPGGLVAACVWDFEEGMQMLRCFWDAALDVDPNAPDEARVLRFGRPGEIAELFTEASLEDVRETTLSVSTTYDDYDDLWSGFLAGVGPAGSFCLSLDDERRTAVRARMFERLGSPDGAFTLGAVARCASGVRPV